MAPLADSGVNEQGMQQLREWAYKQSHLPAVPDRLLARMLHSCYGSVERTKTTVDNYFTITTHAPEVFGGRGAFDQRFQQATKTMYLAALEERTTEGFHPMLIKFQDADPARFDMVGCVHTGLTVLCVLMEEDDRIPGYVALFDFTGLSMGHIMKISLTCLKQLLVFVQEGLPVRLRGIHFINSVPIVQHIVNLVKPLMKKELIDIFHVHTVEEMPKFYETFVRQSSMPQEYGGKAPKVHDMHCDMLKRIEAHKDYLLALDKLVVDEAKRAGKSKSSSDVFGMQGSFKKLDLD